MYILNKQVEGKCSSSQQLIRRQDDERMDLGLLIDAHSRSRCQLSVVEAQVTDTLIFTHVPSVYLVPELCTASHHSRDQC